MILHFGLVTRTLLPAARRPQRGLGKKMPKLSREEASFRHEEACSAPEAATLLGNVMTPDRMPGFSLSRVPPFHANLRSLVFQK